MTSRKEQLNKTVWPSDPHTMVKHLVYRHCAGPHGSRHLLDGLHDVTTEYPSGGRSAP